jgi:hypothetical protein
MIVLQLAKSGLQRFGAGRSAAPATVGKKLSPPQNRHPAATPDQLARLGNDRAPVVRSG